LEAPKTGASLLDLLHPGLPVAHRGQVDLGHDHLLALF
jgi:hypothetical protein